MALPYKLFPQSFDIMPKTALFDAESKNRYLCIYSITCIQRPLKGSNEIGLLQQVVFKCRFY